MTLGNAGISNLVGEADFARTDQKHPPFKPCRSETCRKGSPPTDATRQLVAYPRCILASDQAEFVETKWKVAMGLGQAFDGVGGSLPALFVAVEFVIVARTAPYATCNDQGRGLADG